nr:replication protein A 70 kDa DNA-binding subunit-like [Ipomoea batatas]
MKFLNCEVGIQAKAKNAYSMTKRLGSQSTPMRSISTTSIISHKTVLNDFITGTVVISTLADLYLQTEEKDEVPTELETMIGKAMVKVNIKKENKHIYGSDFTVMRVLRDDSIVTAYCSSLAPDQERDLISKMIEECSDDDSDMEASQGDEVNSPNTGCKEIQQEGDNQFSPLTKRCLLDQFSSTHNLKKGKN